MINKENLKRCVTLRSGVPSFWGTAIRGRGALGKALDHFSFLSLLQQTCRLMLPDVSRPRSLISQRMKDFIACDTTPKQDSCSVQKPWDLTLARLPHRLGSFQMSVSRVFTHTEDLLWQGTFLHYQPRRVSKDLLQQPQSLGSLPHSVMNNDSWIVRSPRASLFL